MSDGGGLKAADLYVTVGAALGPMVAGLKATVEAVEKTAKKIGEHLGKVSGAVGALNGGLMAFAGAAAASVAVAAQHSAMAAHELERLKTATAVLGREVGEAFVPLIRDMVGWVKTAIATWRGLDGGLKENLVTAVRWAGVLAVGGLALQKATTFAKGLADGVAVMAGITKDAIGPISKGLSAVGRGAASAVDGLAAMSKVDVGAKLAQMGEAVMGFGSQLRSFPEAAKGLGSSFMSVVPKIAAVALPLLAVAAAVGAIVLLAGSLYKSWDDLVYLMNDSTGGIGDSMRELGETVAGFFGDLMVSVKEFISNLATAMLNSVFDRVKAVAAFLESVARKLGRDTLADTLHQVQNLSAQAALDKLKEGAVAVGEVIADKARQAGAAISSATKDVREGVAYGLKHSVEGAQQLGQDLAKSLPLDELMALKDKLLSFLPKVHDDESVTLPGELNMSTVGKDDSYAARLKAMSRDIGKPSEVIQAVRGVLDEFKKRMEDARNAIRDKFTSAFGSVMDVVSAAQQGLAASGGDPIGAVLGAVAELLTKSEGFQTIVSMVNQVVQIAADAFGAFLVPLEPLVGAVGMIVHAVAQVLTPALSYMGEVWTPLIPVVGMLSQVIAALAPLFTILTGVMRLLQLPARILLEGGLRLLFEVIRGLALGILWVTKAISGTWNGLIAGVQRVLSTLSNVKVFGAKPLAFLDDIGKELGASVVPVDQLTQSIRDLNEMTWESARAKAEETAEVLKNRQALEKATESLTNVPSGWKVALARFNAQNGRPAGDVLPTSLPASTYATAPTASAQPIAPVTQQQPLIDTVNINARDPAQALDDLQDMVSELRFRQRGTRAPIGRYAMAE